MTVTMSMQHYLEEIRHAVSGLLPLLWEERDAFAELDARVAALTEVTEREYGAAEWISLNAEDAEDVMLATGRQWETYWGPDKDRYYAAAERDQLHARAQARRFSVDALAGGMLQHAKQGLGMVHAGSPNPPKGRPVGTQQLSHVIWQARNQALHWEEQAPHERVRVCFKQLAVDIDPVFLDYAQRNLALEVLEMLDWKTLDAFERDMLSAA